MIPCDNITINYGISNSGNNNVWITYHIICLISYYPLLLLMSLILHVIIRLFITVIRILVQDNNYYYDDEVVDFADGYKEDTCRRCSFSSNDNYLIINDNNSSDNSRQ